MKVEVFIMSASNIIFQGEDFFFQKRRAGRGYWKFLFHEKSKKGIPYAEGEII